MVTNMYFWLVECSFEHRHSDLKEEKKTFVWLYISSPFECTKSSLFSYLYWLYNLTDSVKESKKMK